MSKATHMLLLVIFGLDAREAEYLRQWDQEGYLPNIVSSMQPECWGDKSEDMIEAVIILSRGFYTVVGPSIPYSGYLSVVNVANLARTFLH